MNNRIDRIDGNKYYEYTKIKDLNISDADEKFSLDYKQNELAAQKEEKKEEKDVKGDKKATSALESTGAKQNGVRLEISQSGRVAAADSRRQPASAKKGSIVGMSPAALLESVREYVTGMIAAVKDFFYKIWNDPQPEGTMPNDTMTLKENGQINAEQTDAALIVQDTDAENSLEQAPEESYRMKEARLDKEIQPYLRSGDLNQVINLLTENGRRTSARNSTLLTYYDRNGRMIEPNASDRERILYGDRNTRKL